VRRKGGNVAQPAGRVPEADILISDDDQAAIAVQMADCVPLLIADAWTGAVAVAHAGWRGTAASVARVAVEALTETFACRPANLIAAIGPCIGPCCYEVRQDVMEVFRAAGHAATTLDRWFITRGGKIRLDLWQATADQLAAAGVLPAQIHTAELCTATHRDVFCSYRAEGSGAGRLAAAIRAGRPGQPVQSA
jgi:YfiH family protein